MRSATIGKHKIPILGLGTYQLGVRSSDYASDAKVILAALDKGITLIDTAELYHNEEFLGRTLQGVRPQCFLVSKVLPSDASYAGTKQACERSLRKLRTDHLDLYMLHWSSSYPLAETVRALRDLKREGKILEFGLSNIDVGRIKALDFSEGFDLSCDEVLYNLQYRGIEYDLLPFAQSHDMAIIAYSPLSEGRLKTCPPLEPIARKYNMTQAQIALAFTVQQEGVITIPKFSSLEHLQENLECCNLKFDEEDFKLIDSLFPPPRSKVPLKGW